MSTKTYTVKSHIKMDGRMYQPGDSIALKENQLTPNMVGSLESGVVSTHLSATDKEGMNTHIKEMEIENASLNKALSEANKKVGAEREKVRMLETNVQEKKK